MRARNLIRHVVTWLGTPMQRARKPTLICGECERWERCGLPPSDRCIVMLAQLARGRRAVKRVGLPVA